MHNHLHDKDDYKRHTYSRPPSYYLMLTIASLILFALLVRIAVEKYEQVLTEVRTEAHASGMIQGEENAQAILSHPVCLKKEK